MQKLFVYVVGRHFVLAALGIHCILVENSLFLKYVYGVNMGYSEVTAALVI
jgi:hypothetical protein